VREGLLDVAENPLNAALKGWVVGSQDFLKQMVASARAGDTEDSFRLRGLTGAIDVGQVIEVVARMHAVTPQDYVGFRSTAPGREMAALLCRRHTSATLASLSSHFGLTHPDSSANLVRRAQQQEQQSPSYRQRFKEVESALLKTEKQV
jgi:hypothetical protein